MARRPFKPTRLGAALQTASLLAVAAGVFGILISDMTQRGADVARAEALSKVQSLALPRESDGSSR
jgi:hypothetical protein